jgi:CheY-like chemotaxis protein
VAAERSGRAGSARQSGGRVLVITGDATLAGAVASELARDGVPVGHAPDGGEALHRLAAERPAAVVLDLEVPVVSGYRLLRVLGTDRDTGGVPVVVVSDESFQVAREALRDGPAGVGAFLRKPAAPGAVAKRVRDALAA